MNRCRRVFALLSAYIDGDLAPAQARAVEAHLSGCAGCRRELEEWRALLRMVSYHATVSCPIDCAEAVLQRIEDRQLPRSFPSLAPRGRRPLVPHLALGLIVAVVVGGGGWLRLARVGLQRRHELALQYAATAPGNPSVTWVLSTSAGDRSSHAGASAVGAIPAVADGGGALLPALRVHAPDRLQQAFGRSDSLILAADFAEDGP